MKRQQSSEDIDEESSKRSKSPNLDQKRDRTRSQSLSDDSDSEEEKASKRLKVRLDSLKWNYVDIKMRGSASNAGMMQS